MHWIDVQLSQADPDGNSSLKKIFLVNNSYDFNTIWLECQNHVLDISQYIQRIRIRKKYQESESFTRNHTVISWHLESRVLEFGPREVKFDSFALFHKSSTRDIELIQFYYNNVENHFINIKICIKIMIS